MEEKIISLLRSDNFDDNKVGLLLLNKQYQYVNDIASVLHKQDWRIAHKYVIIDSYDEPILRWVWTEFLMDIKSS